MIFLKRTWGARMKRSFFLLLVLFGILAATALADPKSFPALPVPRFLFPKDPIPMKSLEDPGYVLVEPDGKTQEVQVDFLAPPADALDLFSDPGLFEQIHKAHLSEAKVKHFYWHAEGDLTYCHLMDIEGNHWYGWSEGGNFHWILWRGHRYWWHDSFAGHWLYYYRGLWWRADGQDKGQIQACVNGEYYLCDKDGNVLKDMGEDGEGNLLSAPNLRHHGGHHGGSGGHGGQNNPGTGGASPPGSSNASPSQPPASSAPAGH